MEEMEVETKEQPSATLAGAVVASVDDDAPAPNKVNGIKHADDEDTANDDELSPPPDNMSPVSSSNDRALEDEIVVRSSRNGVTEKSSPLRVVSDQEDEGMLDAGGERPIVATASHYPKRKRASLFNDLSEDRMESSLVDEKETTPRSAKPPRRHGLGGVKGVTLGYWRDSPVPNEEGKHAVIGFIDVRDRLRTRVQTHTRSGEPVSATEYPLPPGPGGSWVTFQRVVFEKHLVGLDHFVIKEYVKIRTDAHEDTEEERIAAEKAAAKEAVRRIQANPPPEPAVQPAIAYGPDFPTGVANAPGPDVKRRRTGSGIGTISAGGPVVPDSMPHHLDPLPGTRPTRILLGYWKGSSESNPADRHAVYGILGQNDMFRVKVVRETRDGRFVDGNFPSGAGALWIHYEEVEFEPYLKELNRAEVKEYCRVRQRQLDDKEAPEDRVANEKQAVFEAQARIAQGFKSASHHGSATFQPRSGDDDTAFGDAGESKPDSGGHELRQTRRAESRAPRHALPDLETRQSSRTPTLNDRAKAETIARREIARVEAAQQRAERHAEQRAAAITGGPDRPSLTSEPPLAAKVGSNGARMSSMFHERDEMQRLNKVWASQEEHRSKVGGEDTKFYSGIKYERKTNGPFVGKLVSQGTIISIDGEDYVEYRVLTKPSFF